MLAASVSPALQWFGWWPFAVDTLAAYRVARLVCRDEIASPLRARLDSAWGMGRPSALWTCTCCLGFWCAVLAVYLHTLLAALGGNTLHLIWMLIALPWAMSAAICLISDREAT